MIHELPCTFHFSLEEYHTKKARKNEGLFKLHQTTLQMPSSSNYNV